jgi:hypothetical protein
MFSRFLNSLAKRPKDLSDLITICASTKHEQAIRTDF